MGGFLDALSGGLSWAQDTAGGLLDFGQEAGELLGSLSGSLSGIGGPADLVLDLGGFTPPIASAPGGVGPPVFEPGGGGFGGLDFAGPLAPSSSSSLVLLAVIALAAFLVLKK